MARTTIDIANPVLAEVRKLQRREGRPMGKIVSELLAEALASRSHPSEEPATLRWHSKAMDARIDLSDKEAIFALLDRDDSGLIEP